MIIVHYLYYPTPDDVSNDTPSECERWFLDSDRKGAERFAKTAYDNPGANTGLREDTFEEFTVDTDNPTFVTADEMKLFAPLEELAKTMGAGECYKKAKEVSLEGPYLVMKLMLGDFADEPKGFEFELDVGNSRHECAE